MRHALGILLFCSVFSAFAFGQTEFSKADLFGGYSYVNIDTNGISPRQNANGWEVSISGNFNRWFAVEGDVNGFHKNFGVFSATSTTSCIYFNSCSPTTVHVTDYAYAAGPRINLRPVFIHALFGGDHLTGSAVGYSASQDGAAGELGGGVQARVSGPWSARLSADYAFTRHNIFGGPSVTQNNFRVAAGIVYSFGKSTTVSPRPTTQKQVRAALKIAALGILVSVGQSKGAEIVDEDPNGVAALAGLHPGDVINSVNGSPVASPTVLKDAMSFVSPGTKVRLGFAIRGQWQSETTVLVRD